MKQARCEVRKQAKAKRSEKAAELQCALEDRAAARRLVHELAELDRGSIRWAARFKVQVKPERPSTRTSPVAKRATIVPRRGASSSGVSRTLSSSWVVDDAGMRGVSWQQSYLGRQSPRFYRGAARDNWEYDVRDEAVLLDSNGEPIITSNMGDDWVEIGVAWQAMENASTRKNAKVQIRAIAAFDSDMSREEMIVALNYFCETILAPMELPYSAVIHSPSDDGDQRNFHAHLAFSLRPMRRVQPYCWEVADEVRGEFDGKNGVQMLRHLWAHSMSEAAESAGRDMRYTGLGYGARGLTLEASEHLGEGRAAIVARGGYVPAHERNRLKNQRNTVRRVNRDADRKIAALTTLRDAAQRRIASRGDIVQTAEFLGTAEPVSAARVRQASKEVVPAMLRRQIEVQPASFVLQSVVCEPALQLPALAPPDTLTPSRRLVPAIRPQAASLITPPPVVVPAERRRVQSATLHAPARRLSVATMPGAPVSLRLPDPVRPRVELVQSFPSDDGPHPIHLEWMRALDRARALRGRKRKERSRHEDRIDLDSFPTIEDLPARELLELHPFAPEGVIRKLVAAEDEAHLQQLRLMDSYVADYGGGAFEIVLPAMKAIGVDDAWMNRPHVQRALADVRTDQQRVVVAMMDEAARRPLAFAKSGPRFWPRDLDAADLRRLDRWAADPGFQQDVFSVEQRIYQAHEVRNDAARQTSMLDRAHCAGEGSAAPSGLAIPDGFGGLRETPPPAKIPGSTGLRIRAFDLQSGAPSPSLLMLLNYSGKHPHQLAFANDGRLMVMPGAPKLIEPLISLWRHDDRVEALVVRTVAASREAERPVWPKEHAAAISAIEEPQEPDSSRRFRANGIER